MNAMTMLPPAVCACLWSYDVHQLDVGCDRGPIIRSVLNHGTLEAVRWLRATYPGEELAAVFEHSAESEWSRKSLRYWSTILGIVPRSARRTPVPT